jgi:hypothetical protein
VKAGPHKHELRRALMQELRGHSGVASAASGAVSDPSSAASHAAHPWLRRLGYAFGLLAALGCIVLVIWTQSGGGGGSLFAHQPNSAATTQQGFSAVIGIDAGKLTRDEANQLADAIDKGNFELSETLPFKSGGRVFLYRVTLQGGRQIVYASDHVMPTKSQLHLLHAHELQQSIEKGNDRFVAERRAQDGSMIYFYRAEFSDGSSDVYGSDVEPDPSRAKLHSEQLEQAMAQFRGELSKTIAGADGTQIYLIKVTLPDGTIKTYASADKPKTK